MFVIVFFISLKTREKIAYPVPDDGIDVFRERRCKNSICQSLFSIIFLLVSSTFNWKLFAVAAFAIWEETLIDLVSWWLLEHWNGMKDQTNDVENFECLLPSIQPRNERKHLKLLVRVFHLRVYDSISLFINIVTIFFGKNGFNSPTKIIKWWTLFLTNCWQLKFCVS